MSKNEDSKHPRASGRGLTPNWQPLFQRLIEVVDWSLDIAVRLAGDDDDEIDEIENVRDFIHGWLEGRRAEIPVTELLTTIAIIFSAIELDLGIDSVSLLTPMRTMLDTPSELPAVLRCPGAGHESRPTMAIRRFPGRRNAGSAFTHLAA